ncbi:MAG: hypothetical protein KF817_13400 [Phycisphaeraceae bacterium]|nr:hypothetical protein [Phycisphaeraceae bacterium]
MAAARDATLAHDGRVGEGVQDREPGDLAGGRLARVNDTPEHERADLLPDRWKLLNGNAAVRQIAAAAARRRAFAVTRPR